jgi:hypothetical protein
MQENLLRKTILSFRTNVVSKCLTLSILQSKSIKGILMGEEMILNHWVILFFQ